MPEWVRKNEYYAINKAQTHTISKAICEGVPIYTLWDCRERLAVTLGNFDSAQAAVDKYNSLQVDV